jgi:hypothetical protein
MPLLDEFILPNLFDEGDVRDEDLSILVNGPREWYENINNAFKAHGHSWMQQNKKFKTNYAYQFTRQLKRLGYILVYGYVHAPEKCVRYLYVIDKILEENQRISPPDNTAPVYGYYDSELGKCQGAEDYKYYVWMRIIGIKILRRTPSTKFLNVVNSRFVNSFRGQPHYYVKAPKLIPYIKDNLLISPQENDIQTASIEIAQEILDKNSGQGFLLSSKARLAVENYAVRKAKTHYQNKGFVVTEVGKPYDLLCERGGNILYVEVKGTQGEASKIFLTRNEVVFARKQHPNIELFIVKNIKLRESEGNYISTGGNCVIIPRWVAIEEKLSPLTFEYNF